MASTVRLQHSVCKPRIQRMIARRFSVTTRDWKVSCDLLLTACTALHCPLGPGMAQWLERRIRNGKVAGWFESREELLERKKMVTFPCGFLFRYPSHSPPPTPPPHPSTIAVASKRSPCHFAKSAGGRLGATAKHTCTLRMWLCMK